MICHKMFILILFLTIAIAANAEEKIKLTGTLLADRITGYEVLAGVYKKPGLGFNFMVTAYKNGTRELYWNDGIKSGTDKGTHRFVDDQTCVTWENSFEGQERCYDVYKIGENKYESYWNNELEYTYYKIR